MTAKPVAKHVLIYGGAFDPPHFGHALCLETALRLVSTEEIWLMPSNSKRADKKVVATAEQRLKMLALMSAECFPKGRVPISISDFELKHPQLATTNQVFGELQKLHPGTTFSFLLGSDLLATMQKEWQEGEEFYQSTTLVVVEQADHPVKQKLPANITVLQGLTAKTNLTSTFIRHLLQDGHHGQPYLARAVSDYIVREHLYGLYG